MQWVVITANDLNDYLVGVQVDALRQTALADGQDDPFTRVMQDRANYVRRRIESNPSNRISATPYAVPPELKTGTCYLIIEALQPRLKLPLTEDQKKQIQKAEDYLNRIADEKDVVAIPDDPLEPSDAQSGGAISVVSSNTRRATREKMNGL
jgi:hypothetical protein